jgi:hypothetical protein
MLSINTCFATNEISEVGIGTKEDFDRNMKLSGMK